MWASILFIFFLENVSYIFLYESGFRAFFFLPPANTNRRFIVLKGGGKEILTLSTFSRFSRKISR